MVVDVFQMLADPTRRTIVEAMRGGERQVNDIVERVGIHQSGVSRHLRILGEAGFVAMRPDGQRHLYSLRPEPFRELGSVAFAKRLMEGADIAVAPGAGFGEYGDGYVRIALVENEQRIRQAARNLKRFLQSNAAPAAAV